MIIGFHGFGQLQHFTIIGDRIASRIDYFPLTHTVIEFLVLVGESPLHMPVPAPVCSQVTCGYHIGFQVVTSMCQQCTHPNIENGVPIVF